MRARCKNARTKLRNVITRLEKVKSELKNVKARLENMKFSKIFLGSQQNKAFLAAFAMTLQKLDQK